jgi:hypothetical protein
LTRSRKITRLGPLSEQAGKGFMPSARIEGVMAAAMMPSTKLERVFFDS